MLVDNYNYCLKIIVINQIINVLLKKVIVIINWILAINNYINNCLKFCFLSSYFYHLTHWSKNWSICLGWVLRCLTPILVESRLIRITILKELLCLIVFASVLWSKYLHWIHFYDLYCTIADWQFPADVGGTGMGGIGWITWRRRYEGLNKRVDLVPNLLIQGEAYTDRVNNMNPKYFIRLK